MAGAVRSERSCSQRFWAWASACWPPPSRGPTPGGRCASGSRPRARTWAKAWKTSKRRSRPARKAVRAHAEELSKRGRKKYEELVEELEDFENEADEDEEDGGLSTVLAIGAGLAAAALFMTSERAAPARERVREAAATVRDEAEARWDRFQRRRDNGHQNTESGTRIDPADSAPHAS